MAEVLPSRGEDDPSAADKIHDAHRFLESALDSLDSARAPPELAARVQEALDAVARFRATS